MRNLSLIFTLIAAVAIWNLTSCAGSESESGSYADHDSISSVSQIENERAELQSYKIIVYDDDSGEFLAPDGSRICGIGHTNGRSSKMDVYLTKEVKIFGVRTDRLQFIDGRLFASYEDYLSYSHGKGNKNSATVNIDENDNRTVFSFALNYNDVENSQTTKVDLSSLGDNYKMVMYSDDTGALYDPNNQRLCGLEKTIYETVDYEWRFGKEIDILGKKVQCLAVYKGYLFYSAMDKVWDDRGKTKYRVAKVSETHQGDATIITFPNERLDSYGESNGISNYSSNVNDNNNSNKWIQGKWIRTEIDPTMIEVIETVITFRGNNCNISEGSEYTFHTVANEKYRVEGDKVFLGDSQKPQFKIDMNNNQLIDIVNYNRVYNRY